MKLNLIIRKVIKIILVFILVLLSLFLVIGLIEVAIDFFYDNASSIDSCLDLQGKWDYVKKVCIFKN